MSACGFCDYCYQCECIKNERNSLLSMSDVIPWDRLQECAQKIGALPGNNIFDAICQYIETQ